MPDEKARRTRKVDAVFSHIAAPNEGGGFAVRATFPVEGPA